MKTCPKCGAVEEHEDCVFDFVCGSYFSVSDALVQSESCRSKDSKFLSKELQASKARISQLESELESHAWTVSHAMVQASIDQMAKRIEALEKAGDVLLECMDIDESVSYSDWIEKSWAAKREWAKAKGVKS